MQVESRKEIYHLHSLVQLLQKQEISLQVKNRLFVAPPSVPHGLERCQSHLTLSPIDSHLPTFSTFSQDKQRDDEVILQDYEEPRDNRQTACATRRKTKVKNLVLVIEVNDDVNLPQSSETDTYFVSQNSSSGSQKDDDL
ncbi:hypothetical protein F8M41_013170 [Gigaspora margarita]|uniref:Uncharacterized protein n=1 Tax=Gigaspora margarita TaxID=4874 RepID=A0A8H4A0L4_GIGMA|nr:hypothetical protein F8M41_013170 [Gigaspora margarita]